MKLGVQNHHTFVSEGDNVATSSDFSCFVFTLFLPFIRFVYTSPPFIITDKTNL